MSNGDLRSTDLPGDPIRVPSNRNNMESVGIAEKVEEKYDHGNELDSSDVRTNPFNKTVVEQEQESTASGSSGTEADAANSGTVNPAQNCETGANQHPEMQNPPLQVMERPEDTVQGSLYKIPSHVFNSTGTSTPEWSIASNESLFSIHTETMSFTKEVPWFKSGELEKYGGMIMPGPPNSSQSNQPPGNNKFNDMSQRTAEQDQGSGVTEAKAAETMREVIMENTQKNAREELSIEERPSPAKVLSNPINKSGHSDVSTKSFAFKPFIGDGSQRKNESSKHGEEKPKKQSPEEESTNGAEALGSTGPQSSNREWLSCFACCAFCR